MISFWNKVDIRGKDDCWDWKAALKKTGYGLFKIEGKMYTAHRLAWELTNGPIPEGMLILHKCDNRKCCNIEHLYCGTYQDNKRDQAERNPIPSEVLGSGSTKLLAGEIWLIRRLKVPLPNRGNKRCYKFSASFVSKMFKVTTPTILSIWSSSNHLCKEGYYV